MENKNIAELYRDWDGETKPSNDLMELISNNPFELTNIVVSNYKAFSDKVSVKFESNFDPVLFVGVNASGKTTIAESIAKSLSKINSAIYNKNNDSGDMIDEKNINKKNGEYQYASIKLDIGYENKKLASITLAKSPVGVPKNVSSILIEAKKLGVMYSYMLAEKYLDLPLYLFYGVDRSLLKSKDKFEKTEIYFKVDRLKAIPQKLTNQLNFDDFLLWFKYLDDSNNQDIVNIYKAIEDELNNLKGKTSELYKYSAKSSADGINRTTDLLQEINRINSLCIELKDTELDDINNSKKSRHLEKIKEIIIKFIPDIKDIKVDRSQPYPFIAEKIDGSKFLLSELSQGEKSIISLVGDLARRMLILNPHKDNPLETPAIVIIDELELHLHPTWQKDIICKLKESFPKTKFILTTHTPTVVSSIINQNIYLISDNKITQFKDQGTYGAEYSRIYKDLYNIELRPDNEITKMLDRYLELIDKNKYDSEEAVSLRTKLDKNFKNKGRICAYCEQDFSCNAGDDDYITQVVEHFHPKRDINTKNWALDWNNLLGCCTGGTEANGSIFPRPDNLSCDKYKEIALPNIDNVEGELINPIDMPAFPCLFNINKFTGKLSSDKDNCESFNFSSNNKKDTKELVDSTINVLNLNCNRLLRKRKEHIRNYQVLIKEARDNGNESIFEELCKRFLEKKNGKYHAFFTTYRILLSEHAENYLKNNNFLG